MKVEGKSTSAIVIVSALIALPACGSKNNPVDATGVPTFRSDCIVSTSDFGDGGVGKDGIPALTNPELVDPAQATYLTPDSRVIGMMLDGSPLAIPHNILWWHEIVNLTAFEADVAVTYCPLTGSSMAFDRAAVGGAELGVSGLLFKNNLTMYDRNATESLWPQMMGAATCGAEAGSTLDQVPVFEMSWSGWQALHPTTRVVSANTGHRRVYTSDGYPYGDYERENNPRLLFQQSIDGRRPPKERVLGIAVEDGGIALPFGELDTQPLRAVNLIVAGRPVGVIWRRDHVGALAFETRLDGQDLELKIDGGRVVDVGTGTTWRLDGLATAGPLAGSRLEPVTEAYVAFWFAWAAFQPETTIWTVG